jgi:hypothetical protein
VTTVSVRPMQRRPGRGEGADLVQPRRPHQEQETQELLRTEGVGRKMDDAGPSSQAESDYCSSQNLNASTSCITGIRPDLSPDLSFAQTRVLWLAYSSGHRSPAADPARTFTSPPTTPPCPQPCLGNSSIPPRPTSLPLAKQAYVPEARTSFAAWMSAVASAAAPVVPTSLANARAGHGAQTAASPKVAYTVSHAVVDQRGW